MFFRKSNDIDRVWRNICKHEGETFVTVARKIPYNYVVNDDYILINNDKKRRITRSAIESALNVKNPTASALTRENIWGPSYVCGIITDSRIV